MDREVVVVAAVAAACIQFFSNKSISYGCPHNYFSPRITNAKNPDNTEKISNFAFVNN